MAETTSRGKASTGSRGITPLPPGAPKLSTAFKNPGEEECTVIDVADSFPSDDGWWTPPVHGEDVECLRNNSQLEELEEIRLQDPESFLVFLKAHGCYIRDQDFLSCFETEEGLQPLFKRRDNRRTAGLFGVDPPGPDHDDYVLLMKTSLKTFFNLDWEWGHLVSVLMSSEEGELLERHLNAIPEDLGKLKREFKACNEEAGNAVRCSDWKTACQCYEDCLRILVCMEKGLWTRIQTWLLLCVCIPLVHMYQLWLKNYPKCIAIYDRILQQLNQEDTDGSEGDGSLGQLYYILVWHRRLVLFEWSHSLDTKADGDQGRRLLSLYVRSKAFNVVAVQNKEAQGFDHLMIMTNKWGRQSNLKSGEGDMRIAFCFNLQHLFKISQQLFAERVKWTREKWVWINPIDVDQESKIRWKIEDIEALYLFNMADEGLDDIELLRKEIAQLEGCKIQKQIFECSIAHWEAKFCMNSDPVRAEQLVRKADSYITKLDNSPDAASNTIATELAQLRAKILHDRVKGRHVLIDSPYGVQERAILNKDLVIPRAEEATELFKMIDSSGCLSKQPGSPSALIQSRMERLRGSHLFWDLYVHKVRRNGQISSTYVSEISEKFDEMIHAFQMSLQMLSHSVHTLQPTRKDEITCHIELGNCYSNAVTFKDPDLKICNDAAQGLKVHRDCHLNTAIQHFQQALVLATSGDSQRLRIITGLGSAHFEKATNLYDRLQEFLLLIPDFLDLILAEDPQSNKSQIRLEQERNCGNFCHLHLHSLTVEPGREVSYAVDQGVKGSKLYREWTKAVPMRRLLQSGTSRVTLHWLIDQLVLIFVEDMLVEVQQSADHLLESLKMDFAIPFDAQEDGHSFAFDKAVWERAESSKIRNTKLQFLYGIGFSVGDVRQIVDIRRAFDAVPEHFQKIIRPEDYHRIVNELKYLRHQGFYPKGLTGVQKGLLWAERGRSRILINQFVVANKLLRDATEMNDLVNLNFTDKKSWRILRAAQLACGDNTVFVEYVYDTYLGGGYIDQVFVYVISKEGEVVLRDIDIGDPQDFQASLKRVHEHMSKPLSSQGSGPTIQTDLEKLYVVFIEPISDLLDGMESEDKLVFALDDVLTNVPFSILLNAETGKYLIESHTISFTPALRVLALCNKRFKSLNQASQRVGPSVALGDPAYKSVRMRLVHTLKEVTKIPDFFKDGSVKVITGPEASISNLLKSANLPVDTVQGFVHVAAHGLLDDRNRSGSLWLANTDKKYQDRKSSNIHSGSFSGAASSHQRDEDVRLENDELEEVIFDGTLHKFEMLGVGCVRGGSISELMEHECITEEDRKSGKLRSENIVKLGFEWRSRMVVLSACNTAKGYVLKTEGVVGLPRAFLVAGVPCVVASQWKLQDEASSELMQKFYQEMSRGSDTATAMRAAMLRMKSNQGSSSEIASSVYKWGGYLVWGLPTVTLPTCMLKTPCLPPQPISIHGSRKKIGRYYPGKLLKELWANDLIEKWIYALFLLAVVTRKWTSAVLFQALLANTLFLQMLMFSIYLITEKVILSKST